MAPSASAPVRHSAGSDRSTQYMHKACTTVVHALCIYWVLRSLPALWRTGAEAEGAIDLTVGGEGQEKIRNLFGADVLGRTGLLIDDQGVSAVVGEPSSALMPLPSSELHTQPAAL